MPFELRSRKYFDQFSDEGNSVVEDVRVSGGLAVARGTAEGKAGLKAGGGSAQYKYKWMTAFQRQPDGSWKAFEDIWNSDLPVADALPLGQEELALLKIEQDWAEALVKKDAAAFDKTLAAEFQANYVGIVGNKKQYLSVVMSNISKSESVVNSEMKAIVFGNRGIVNGLSTEKSSMAGKDTSGQYRWTDVFVKRDGQWQCVTGYASKVE
jgi:ketosteroid isomerase-like protein